MDQPQWEPDPLTQFFIEAHRIVTEANFVVTSLPNAEIAAVERSVHQLEAIREILLHIDQDDPHSPPEDIEHLLSYLDDLLLPLEQYLASPPPPPSAQVPREAPNGRGRPRYVLDVHRAVHLHDLGLSWKDISGALGVSRKTLYNHLAAAGLSTSRPAFADISDDDLDEVVAEISLAHPLAGSIIIRGHLEARHLHVPLHRVQASLRRVDAIGVLVRWAGIIKRRVYRVRGANALWHMDGNEKLRPWGFYVHGCIDGFSRLIIYLVCCSNKRAATVARLYSHATCTYGWPSRTRGDYGTENNDVERMMKEHWGEAHNAFLRGRSLHNVRIERLWRDVRKDSLEVFRQVFMYLEECELLDMSVKAQRVCLFLVFQPRVQASLNRTTDAWNHHKIRTERNRTPVALFELSREIAIQRGYWTGDPGDSAADAADPLYGVDGQAPAPPAPEVHGEPGHVGAQPRDEEGERGAGITTNTDSELEEGRRILAGFDFERDDGNWGIDVYCEAVTLYNSRIG